MGSDEVLPIIYASLVDDEDEPEFRKIYEKYKNIAFQKAVSILGNDALAEECVSEVFLAVAMNFQKVNSLKSYEQKKYIVICSRNIAVNMIRKSNKEQNVIPYDDDINFIDDNFSKYSAVEWQDYFKKLNQTDLEILYLVYVQGLNYKEISKMYGINYASAKQRLYTAKCNLRKIIMEEGDKNDR